MIRYQKVLAETEHAVLLDLDGDGDSRWFPRSVCEGLEDAARDDGPGEFACPQWLVDREGLA